MRIRSVKPEFWSDQKVGVLDAETRLAFIWTWGAADDWGCLKLSPGALRSGAFECHDMTLARGREIIDTLTATRRVIGYVVDGEMYAFIPSWFKHQRPNNPAAPLHPTPPIDICDEAIAFLREYATALRSECSGRERKNTAAMSRAYQSLPCECLDTKARAAREDHETLKTLSGECKDTSAPGAGEQGSRGAGEQGSRPPTGGEAPSALPLLAATSQTSTTATAKPWSKTITREQADLVFELWRKKFKKGDRWKFTSECQSKLRARANEGLKYIEARLAVHGCSSLARTVVYKDGTLRGDDENSIAFTLIFRSQSKTRGFIAEAEKAIHFVGQHLSEDMTKILKKDGTVVMEV